MAEPFVLILGMHRSGTSCLAGSLERCGLFLGDVNRANRANASGNHELRRVTRLHRRILRRNGGDWRHPPGRVRLGFWQRRALDRLLADLSARAPAGAKDPRMLLLLDAWLGRVDDARLVGTYRHPAAVAASLDARNGIGADEAHRLWAHYNAELVRRHRAQPFPILEFDLADLDAYVERVVAVASHLGLSPDPSRVAEFASRSLQHHATDGTVPEACRASWDYLRAHRVA